MFRKLALASSIVILPASLISINDIWTDHQFSEIQEEFIETKDVEYWDTHPLITGNIYSNSVLESLESRAPPQLLSQSAEIFTSFWRLYRTFATGAVIMGQYYYAFSDSNPWKIHPPWKVQIVDKPQKNQSTVTPHIDELGKKLESTAETSEVEDQDAWFTTRDIFLTSEQAKKNTASYNNLNQKCAQILIDHISWARGPYIKMGQMIAASNNGFMPKEYTDGCKIFQSAAPKKPYPLVQRQFLEAFSTLPSYLFRSFERTPFASASLAQVHRARMLDGSFVCIKVQHYDIQKQWAGDLQTAAWLLQLAKTLFPHFRFESTFQAFKENTTAELNFSTEAKNGKRASIFFEDNPDVHVPAVIDSLSSDKILTMEYIYDGVHINEFDKLGKLYDLEAVTDLLFNAFGQQIFIHGFVNADPHPGNIMVRPNPIHPLKPQLVLLDHGLYRRIGGPFRRLFSRIITSLVTLDSQGLSTELEKIGLGEFGPVFPLLLTMSPTNRTLKSNLAKRSEESLKISNKDFTAIRNVWRSYSRDQLKQLASNLPADFYLIIRTLTILRSLQIDLQSHSNRFLIFARNAIIGANTYHPDEPKWGFTPGVAFSFFDNEPARRKQALGESEPPPKNITLSKLYFEMWIVFWRLWFSFMGIKA